MRPIDWAVVAAYLIWVVWDGLRPGAPIERRRRLLPRRRPQPAVVAGRPVGDGDAAVSAITMIGTTGQAYIDGMRFLQNYYALPIAMIILSMTLVPFFHRANVFTAYQYLETRFDAKVRTFTALLFLFSRSLSCSVVISAPGGGDVGDPRPERHPTCLLIGIPDHDLHDVRRRARGRLHRLEADVRRRREPADRGRSS